MLFSWFLILIVNLTNANGGTQWPDRCLKNKAHPCVLYIHKKTFFSVNKNTFYTSKDSLLEWTDKGELIFYKGTSWAKFVEASLIELPFGNLQAFTNSEVVLEIKENRAVVRVLSGKVRVSARADKEAYDLTEGTEVELGPVDYSRKVASITLPRSISMSAYLKSIQLVFPFSDLNFQEHLEKVGKSIRSGLYLQSKWGQTIVETKLSDARRDTIRQKYEAESADRRDSLLRRIFRQKNNFEEE